MQWAKEKFREELAGRLTAQVCQNKKKNSSMIMNDSNDTSYLYDHIFFGMLAWL